MSLEDLRGKVKACVEQAIQKNGFDLPSEDQKKRLVNHIVNDVMVLLYESLGDTGGRLTVFTEGSARENVRVLWRGKPLLSLTEHYVITEEQIAVVSGLFGKDYEHFELIRVQDIDFDQSFFERLLGIGDIYIRGSNPSRESITLRNIREPHQVYEILRKAWLAARKKYGLVFREEM